MKKAAIVLLLVMFLASCSTSKQIKTPGILNLPEPIGPYSHSAGYGGLIFVSGQIGIDPQTNILKDGIEQQALQSFENLKAVLQESNSDMDHIVKTTIFLTDLKQFELVNKIYSSLFNGRFPARSTIEVAALPKNALIEIECIAVPRQ